MKKLLNEKGFTLLETLFSLVLFLMIISISTSSIKSFVKRNYSYESVNRLELDNFIKEVQKEANKSISFTVHSDLLLFEEFNQVTISYRKYATIIRRQRLGLGHEIVLQNIRDIKFKLISERQILVKVIDLNGVIYEKTIRMFIN
ncbi:competence type IV pilus minor pilin ComGF [Gottfriedia acidiceleris]|uniref:ComGF family competence protein n=1 Tax=Gottfriedia acidiceleris TaxID=371036 RepID=A0ABY4JQG4_9BACI|nr:competence type IV pilus minor pilin ComGF [Gottfriedia acidiceleris]UPM55686.1 ComGF family competence protein [Gottfriedia acidiceleris]